MKESKCCRQNISMEGTGVFVGKEPKLCSWLPASWALVVYISGWFRTCWLTCTSTEGCCACKQGWCNVKREPIPCNKWQGDLFLEFKIFGRFGTNASRLVRKPQRNICKHSSEVAAQVTSSSSNGGYQPVCAQLGSGKQSAPLIAYLTGVTQGNETTLWNAPIGVQSQLPASPAHVRVCVLLHAGIPLLPFHFPFAVNSNR